MKHRAVNMKHFFIFTNQLEPANNNTWNNWHNML